LINTIPEKLLTLCPKAVPLPFNPHIFPMVSFEKAIQNKNVKPRSAKFFNFKKFPLSSSLKFYWENILFENLAPLEKPNKAL